MILKVILQCCLVNLVYSVSTHPILIIVSYDAFRYNFFDTNLVPQMQKLRHEGTYSDYLINVFPTKTFPNHHSIATGLYPEVHGVIGNSYFDPKLQKVMNISYEMFHYNDEIVPIWRLNEEQGDGRYSGSVMWPGSGFSYQNKNITYMQPFDLKYDWFRRVDDAISWITNPDKPANLVMIYFEEPDTHGHAFGPNSKTVKDLLVRLDNITQYLEDKLVEHNLKDKANVIHLSDHGLIAVKPPQFINVSQYLTPDTYRFVGASPCVQVFPKSGHESEVLAKLLNASSQTDAHFKVHKKEDYLDRWHYKHNLRSPPILLMADVGYALDDLIIAAPKYAKRYNFTLTSESEFGVHGYDYNVTDMHPYFMARGPRIKPKHNVTPFHTVDLFNLFCNILEISATQNNGTKADILDILVPKSHGKYNISTILIITVGGILTALALITCAIVITLFIVKRQQNITTTAALNKRFPQTSQAFIEAQRLLEVEDS